MKKLIVIFSALLLLASCSSMKVMYDFDKEADFANYKTYSFNGWAEESNLLINAINKKRIEEAFATELKARGLKYAEEGGDLLVSLYLVISNETSVTAYTDHYGGRYGYGRGWGWGYGYGNTTTTYDEYHYQKGTLIFDAIDTKSNALVWQGVGTRTIEENQRKREARIKESAKKIMDGFPVAKLK